MPSLDRKHTIAALLIVGGAGKEMLGLAAKLGPGVAGVAGIEAAHLLFHALKWLAKDAGYTKAELLAVVDDPEIDQMWKEVTEQHRECLLAVVEELKVDAVMQEEPKPGETLH